MRRSRRYMRGMVGQGHKGTMIEARDRGGTKLGSTMFFLVNEQSLSASLASRMWCEEPLYKINENQVCGCIILGPVDKVDDTGRFEPMWNGSRLIRAMTWADPRRFWCWSKVARRPAHLLVHSGPVWSIGWHDYRKICHQNDDWNNASCLDENLCSSLITLSNDELVSLLCERRCLLADLQS